MSLYLRLVFALLTFELGLFIMLVVPIPFKWRKALFALLSNSPLVSRGIYGLKILFIFVTVLFVDSLQHMLRIHNEGVAAREKGVRGDLRAETDWRSRKFLSERNAYLTGFTLFLALSLNRTYTLILDLIKCQEKLATYEKKKPASNVENVHGTSDEKLKQLQKEYDALSEKYNALEGSKSSKRVD